MHRWRNAFAALLIGIVPCLGCVQSVKASPAAATALAAQSANVLLILVSIDGMRADYRRRGVTPTLDRMSRHGVSAPFMRPSFPTLTFPNHYSMVTGLYPDHHGIVDNAMMDPFRSSGNRFSMGNYDAVSDRRWWDMAEPIWVTAKAQGKKTATLFWVGSEAPVGGVRPDQWMHYDGAISPDHRVGIILDWLDQPPEKRPDFITLYFDRVDHAGHVAGPDSREVDAALKETDAALAKLMSGLKMRRIEANILVVSDHGMAATPRNQVQFIADEADVTGLTNIGGSTVLGFSAKDAEGEAKLARLPGQRGHALCHRKADLPHRFHYGSNPRVPDVICLAETGWVLRATRPQATQGGTPPDATNSFGKNLGEHGYDPADPQMNAVFLAIGPAFKRGVIVKPFDNVDIYPLLAHLLEIKPRSGDGKIDSFDSALRPQPGAAKNSHLPVAIRRNASETEGQK